MQANLRWLTPFTGLAFRCCTLGLIALLLTGCENPSAPVAQPSATRPTPATVKERAEKPAARTSPRIAPRPATSGLESPFAEPLVPSADAPASSPAAEPPLRTLPRDPPRRTSLADLVAAADAEPDPLSMRFSVVGGVRAIDEQRAAAAGIRKVEGEHVTLFTDLPPSPEVDELPRVFDLAMPEWCQFFGVPEEKVRDWKLRGYVMKEPERFKATGLMPADLPPFPNGIMRDWEFWLYEQPSDYYRRHLFLHEGTHAFMFHFLGGGGPAWYWEGNAELCGTHRWHEGKLTLRYFPQNKEEVPEWGRTRIMRDETAAGRGMSAEGIMNYSDRAHLRNEPYAWCWGLSAFLDGHPRFATPFRAMQKHVANRTSGFNDRFRAQLSDDDWTALREQWQLFVVNCDYGYDVASADFTPRPGLPLPADGTTVQVAADKYWQSSGVRVEGGKTYRISATGEYIVGETTKPWSCEPQGVTIRYHQGRPLGMLLAAVRADEFTGELTGLANPIPIGAGAVLTAPRDGTLYFVVNEPTEGLRDNRGEMTVSVREEK